VNHGFGPHEPFPEQGAVVAPTQEDAAVRRFTEGKEVRKVVYVPNQLLNLLVGWSHAMQIC